MTFGELAKRLSVWTSRGIVSAVILVAGLAFGRQVLQWWGGQRQASPAPSQLAVDLGSLGDPAQEHVLEFGQNAWRMSRRMVMGDERLALRELEAQCVQTLRASRAPEGEPDPRERAFLDRMAQAKPVQEESGRWRLFAVESAFPMAVGTAWDHGIDRPPNDRIAKPRQRVVTWGLAVPAGDHAWTVYAFCLASHGGGVLSAPELPIPPGGRKTLAIRAADGGAVVAIKGPDRPGQWGEFFDRWLASHGYQTTDAWHHRGAVHSIRAVHETGDSLDVLLTSQGDGEITGLVLLTRGPHKGKQP